MQPGQDDRVAAELAVLSARVESLERQLAELRGASPEIVRPVAPPPRSVALPVADAPEVPDFSKHIGKDKGSLENRIGSQLFQPDRDCRSAGSDDAISEMGDR
ncbi:MAG: hypothetical protein WDN23_03100 [Edaphobacter sp.]